MEKDNDNTQSYVALTKGTMVAHYRIAEKIGAGGMGEVYLAEDTTLKRHIALKFMPAHAASNADMRSRFTREARAAAALSHPNIVTIFEVGEFHSRPFFAMEHVPGETLRDVIKQGKLSTNEAVRLTMQICEGLHEAHEAGVVHRDIKPGNIIIDTKGRARLLDFGLAMVSGEDKLTKTGSTLGTVGYMSPEQVGGRQVDQRSDLFSVGVILYEMLTGRRPFEGDNDAAIVNAITNSVPEPVARFKSGVTGELQQIVDKALAKDPALRYQHADGMLADLKRLQLETGAKKKARFSPWVAAVTVVIVGSFFGYLHLTRDETAFAAENRIAIMYFDNLADSEDSARLGEIAANLLITDLTESQYLDIVSTQGLYDILKNLGKEGVKRLDRETATQVARKAGARRMLLGSILQVEPQFVVTSQLVDVETGTAIASQRITGEEDDDIFTIIDRLTVEVKNDMSLPAQAENEPDRPVAEVMTNSPEAMRHYLEALDYSKKLYWEDAVASFRTALRFDSTFAEAHYRLGISRYYANRGYLLWADITRAAKYIDNAPKAVQAYIRSIDNLIKGNYSVAVEILQEECEQSPQEKEAFMLLAGLKWFFQYETAEAIPLLKKVTEIDPLDKLAYNYLAYAYDDVNDFEASNWAINKYISVAPNEANPYDSRGDLYAFQGQLDKAIASYKKALSIKPDLVFTLGYIGCLHLYKQDYAAARKYYRRLATSKNQDTRWSGRERLAFIPIYQGKFGEALEVIDQAMATDQLEYAGDATSNRHRLKAQVFLEKGYLDSALVEIEKAIEIARPYGWDYEHWHHYVQILSARGEFEKAEEVAEALRPVLEEEDRRYIGWYWFAKGSIALARRDYNGAIDHIRKASQLTNRSFGTYAWLHLALARAYLEAGQLGEAVTEYESVLIGYYEPNIYSPLFQIVKAHYYLGVAYEESGWDNKAMEQYEIFLDIWKNADEGLESVEDAKARLARLKSN